MHAWEQIQQTVEYIESHLDEDISIEFLAKEAALSQFYFQRLFSRLVKKPVAEYIKLRRMAKATELLLDRDKRILDIALDLGFSSHEYFTRSFKSTFGMTPEEYRTTPVALNRMTKPELLLNYALVDEGVPLVTEGIVFEINRRRLDAPLVFTGYEQKAPIAFTEGLGVDSGIDPLELVWQKLHNAKATDPLFNKDGEELGVALPCEEEGFFKYFAGTLTSADCGDEYAKWELPAGDYVVCEFEAENFEALVMDALYKAEQYLYNMWLPNHKLTTASFCAERYKTHTPETGSMEVWVKIV